MLTTRTAARTGAAALLAGALLLAGCGSDSDGAAKGTTTTAAKATTTKPAADLQITDVWARKSPAGTTMGAAYLTITSPVDDALLSASVPKDIAKTVQIHETVMADDTSTTMGGDAMGTTTTAMGGGEMTTTTAMGAEPTTTMAGDGGMTMKPVDKIDLPAGQAVELKPGGYHIMLIDLAKPLEVGDSIEITLTFEKAGEKTVTAEVRDA